MPLRLCFVVSELAPLAKTGGLADAAGALAKYLHAGGHDVRVFMPNYAQLDRSTIEPVPEPALQNVPLRLGPHALRFSVLRATMPGGATVMLVDCPALYARDSLYTADADDHVRFLLLAHAALISCQKLNFAPHIVHCHDWHSGFVPLLLKRVYATDARMRAARSVLTIHNIGYQGTFPAAHAADVGLGRHVGALDAASVAAGTLNALREGILHADAVTTVSPTYAREIQTPEYGMGLEDALQTRADAVTGILNGVDYEEWDPRNDPHLPKHFGPDTLQVKAELKAAFLQRLGLARAAPGERRPLVGIVSRLAAQKGFDLLADALPPILAARDMQLVVLGTGEPRYETLFASLQQRFPAKVVFQHGYDNALAHFIEACSDIFLMPSRYEPCGLNQMYSLRYGTVPIVRRTGGLADSVQQFDQTTGVGTGVVFDHYDAGGVTWAIETALDLYGDAGAWQLLVQNAMRQDFSWQKQVGEYVKLYEREIAVSAS